MTLNEKRKAKRISKRLEVKFHSTAENTAITDDLSESGLFITTSKGMEAGNSIDVKLHLPNSEALFIKGRIIRNIKTTPGMNNGVKVGMGIELINPPQDFVNYIQSIISLADIPFSFQLLASHSRGCIAFLLCFIIKPTVVLTN